MFKVNEIYNEDCLQVIPRMDDNSLDLVITSPPYNTSISRSQDKKEEDKEKGTKVRKHSYNRYDTDVDNKSEIQYAEWIKNIFNALEPKLKTNGVIAWNVSYGVSSENSGEDGINNSTWLSLLSIMNETDFTLCEYITWYKSNAIPLSIGNKLSRICEPLFIFCRKSELNTYYVNHNPNKRIGNSIYTTPYENKIDTRYNNDEVCEFNSATYSTEFVEKIIQLYSPKKALIFDPFMGSGTTAVACVECGMNYIGTEISENQVKWAKNRIKKMKGNSLWF